MTLAQLRALIAVAEQGGFTAVSDHTGMSQPAVSRAVAALERELGAALFVRHRDGIALPASGLHTVHLGTHDLLAAVPTTHPLAGQAAVRLADLAGRPFILTTAGRRPLIMAAARKSRVRLDVAFEASGPAAVLEMVAAGLGVSIVPALGLPADLGAVVTRPLEPRTTRSLALAVPSLAECTPAARASPRTGPAAASPRSRRSRVPGGSARTAARRPISLPHRGSSKLSGVELSAVSSGGGAAGA
ncbi:LysR family transcriptional regulator [Nonomuraea sp. LPB2021202275-12-8]|uniref:LysR family transcriptional regulator n=1 Tax=Nonomuraea sp. LPB2021202275-12-8 TaxID=3120159 RepID=UPI00300D8DCF